MTHPAVETRKLTRRYRSARKGEETTALDGVDIEIRPGEVFGLLGPNGAGKTTLIKILATLLSATSGEAFVDGLDVEKDAHEVRRRITMVSGGEHSGYGILNVAENIWMFSQFYGVPGKVARARADALLERLGMTKDARTQLNKLSTGMRQKMNIIRGFVCDPTVLFLDEPTLGLDVQTSREVRAIVRDWTAGATLPGFEAAEGTPRTVLLTTHYMQEADELCHRLAIIDRGKVLACDTPAALKRSLRKEAVFHLDVAGLAAVEPLRAVPGVARVVETGVHEGARRLSVGLEDDHAIAGLISTLVGGGGRLVSLAKVEPTLEDVFVKLVGHGLEDAAGGNGAGGGP
jgi:ABC-2 type transport system ATP-binding protein